MKRREAWREILQKFRKFSTVGVFCTAFSLSANYVLLRYLDTPLLPTYVSVYVCSVAMSYVLNSRFTFRMGLSWKRMTGYYGVYLSSMCLGTGLLYVYRLCLPFENWVLPFLVVPFTMAWNFVFVSKMLARMRSCKE